MQELEDKLKDNLKWIVMNADYELMDKLFKEGFEKEKEQIEQTFDNGVYHARYFREGEEQFDGEDYYNQTFNQDNSFMNNGTWNTFSI